MDRNHAAVGDRENILAEAVVLLGPLAVAVKNPLVLDLDPVYRKGFAGLDTDAVDCDAFVPVDVRLAASARGEPATPLDGRPDHECGLSIDSDFWRVNLQAADYGASCEPVLIV